MKIFKIKTKKTEKIINDLKTIIENNNAIHQQQIASLKNDLEEEKKN